MKTVVIVQARYSSTRFPGKILYKIGNKTLLEILLLRLKKSKLIDKIVVACSDNKKDSDIINICVKKKILRNNKFAVHSFVLSVCRQ